jgi:hypothetical protein
MKYLSLCALIVMFTACKGQQYTHPVKIIYDAKYEHQSLIAFDFLDNEVKAGKLGIELLSIYYTDRGVDFQKIESVKASTVNFETIWKVKVIRKELIDNKEDTVQYFAYIRRSDGALLYANREAGEWIGSTDLEEGLFKK